MRKKLGVETGNEVVIAQNVTSGPAVWKTKSTYKVPQAVAGGCEFSNWVDVPDIGNFLPPGQELSNWQSCPMSLFPHFWLRPTLVTAYGKHSTLVYVAVLE